MRPDREFAGSGRSSAILSAHYEGPNPLRARGVGEEITRRKPRMPERGHRDHHGPFAASPGGGGGSATAGSRPAGFTRRIEDCDG